MCVGHNLKLHNDDDVDEEEEEEDDYQDIMMVTSFTKRAHLANYKKQLAIGSFSTKVRNNLVFLVATTKINFPLGCTILTNFTFTPLSLKTKLN